MEENFSIVRAVSTTSFSSEWRDSESRDLFGGHSTWSTRYNGLQAYVCVFTSFVSALRFCKSVAKYGSKCTFYNSRNMYEILPPPHNVLFFWGVVIFIPFTACNIIVGVPAVLVEIIVGRYVIGSVVRAWNMCPAAKGILWCLMGTSVLAIVQNDVYGLYLLKYTFASFGASLKWTSCDHEWTKINCYEIGKKTNALIQCTKQFSMKYCQNLTWESSADQFWKYYIRSTNSFGQVVWSISCLFISVCIIVIINYKGIRSMEKTFAILVYIPITLAIILALASFHYPHALEGLKQLFLYNWDLLLDSKIWIEGFADTIFFLGLGRLSLSFISSHGKFTDNILIDLVIIISGSFITCLIMTIPILSIVISVKFLYFNETSSEELFIDIEDVFVSMSEAMAFYPFPNTLWSALTFLNWFLISCSSQAVLVLALCETLAEIFHKEDKFHYFISVFSAASFLLGVILIFAPFYIKLDLATVIATTILLTTITWQWFYGIKKFNINYFFMMGSPLPLFVKITWFSLLAVPFIVLVATLHFNITEKPDNFMIFTYAGIPIFLYFITIIIQIILYSEKKISHIFKPNPDWGPENPILKQSRIIFDKQTITTEFMYRQELYKKPFMKPPDFSEQNIVQLI